MNNYGDKDATKGDTNAKIIEGRPQSELRLQKKKRTGRRPMRKVIPHNDTKNLTTKQHKRQSFKQKQKQKQKHQQD